ncbi:MAG: hypothetical protein HUU54_04665 [Ignavibacteriaceae bacterium]|nr:hypothetical protein [Ignavibacteriaceae bacterium]
MNRFVVAVFCFCLYQTVFPQNVKVSDYKVPVSEARNLRLNGNWNWSQRGDSVTSNTANSNVVFRQFYSSLPLAWKFDLDATGTKTFEKYSHSINTEASFRKYIWDHNDWFGTTTIKADHKNTYQQIKSDLSIGYGYGRYINATALAKAVRIEGHLLADRVLSQYLPKETLIAIANIIERQDEYRIIYGATYETYWFNDIEREIKKAGFEYEVGKTALAVLRMRQVLFGINELVNNRYYGWLVSMGFSQPLSKETKAVPVGKPELQIKASYSYPISWELQVNTDFEVKTPIDSALFKKVDVSSLTEFIYELGSRVNFVATYRLNLRQPAAGATIDDHVINASFLYYIENNISLTVNGSLSKFGDTPQIYTTSLGLQYNLF